MTDMRVYVLNRTEKAVLWVSMAAAALALSYLMYRNLIFAVIMIPAAPRIQVMVSGILADRRRRQYMTEFKDFLFMLSTAASAGRSMKDAIGEAIPALENIYGKNSVLTRELALAYERMEIGGENDETVLIDLAGKSGSEDVHDFVTIYSICKTTGASLITALSRAAEVIIGKMTIEREIEEIVRRKEGEGMVILVMPVIVILFLNLFAPDYIAPLYETLAGRMIMTAVIVSVAGIYMVISRITKMVTTMGKMIFSVLVTVRVCSILTILDFSVVRAFMMGG